MCLVKDAYIISKKKCCPCLDMADDFRQNEVGLEPVEADAIVISTLN